jgi:hypothetical protein
MLDALMSDPDAATVICPEACTSSPAFAEAIREFCQELVT